jgi:hypothetical protein
MIRTSRRVPEFGLTLLPPELALNVLVLLLNGSHKKPVDAAGAEGWYERRRDHPGRPALVWPQ